MDGEPIEKDFKTIEWDINAAEKGGYEHFMLKEIYEQPKTVRDTISPRIRENKVVIDELGMTDEEIRAIRKIFIVACGSAYHTGVTAKYVFEGMARIPVEVDLASEFRYRNPILSEGDIMMIISQSGETADSLAALRLAKEKGATTIGIVNVVGSSIAREADKVMYTWAGPEIAVATTKAYSCQLVAEYLLAIKFAKVRGVITGAEEAGYLKELQQLPAQIEFLLGDKEKIQKFANCYVAAKDVFCDSSCNAGTALQEDGQQYCGGEDKRSLCACCHQCRQCGDGEDSRRRSLHSTDESVFYKFTGNYPIAVVQLLCFGWKGTRCG